MKETVGRLETTIDDLKKIVVAVTAASKSTDNAVTAITNAILDSQKVVITNKLDEESVRQLQNKYENIHSKRLNYMRNTVLTLLRCLNGTKTGIMRLSTGGDGVYFWGKLLMRLYIAFCTFFGIILLEIIYGLMKLFG